MSGFNIQYPEMRGSAEEKLQSLKSYLYNLTDQLNMADFSAKSVLSEMSTAITASTEQNKQQETKNKLSEYAALKDLIIKTGDYSIQNSELWSKALSGGLEVNSDFGSYIQQTNLKITATSEGITQLYSYTAGINKADGDSSETVHTQQYIKTGLLFTEDGVPKYGVGVGIINLDIDGEIIKNNKFTSITGDEWAFWDNGVKVSTISNGQINFPAANITGGSINIGNNAFVVSSDGSFSAGGGTFTVNASGAITATGLSIGASQISGLGSFVTDKINAAEISANKITGGTLDFENIAVSNLTVNNAMISSLSVGKITNGSNYATGINFYGINIYHYSSQCYPIIGEWTMGEYDRLSAGYASLMTTKLLAKSGSSWGGVFFDRIEYGTGSSYHDILYSSISTTSLEESKHDITEYVGSAIDVIEQSKLYSYKYIGEDATRYGFIIERECPIEIVNQSGECLNLYDMIAFSWKAIKELNARVEAIES